MSAVRFHATAAVVWVGLILPTLLWWHSSILWVAFMSLYANIAAHAAAWQGARAERMIKEHDGDSD
jgi:hypothetical protein